MSGRPGHHGQQPLPASARPHSPGAVGHRLRLPVFCAVGTALGVGAHTAAAGALPDPALVLAAGAAVWACGAPLRRAERSFETIAAALLAAQALVHAVLGLGHVEPGYLVHLYPGHAMLVAHLLAAGVTAWWLRQGEAAVWAAVGWVWPAPPAPGWTPPAGRAPAAATGRPTGSTGDQDAAVRRTPRRGPPARPAAVLTG